MYDLLELLFDYSANYKRVDRNFYDRVLSFYWNDLKGYLKHVSYDRIVENRFPLKFIYFPMEYNYSNKTITIDEEAIEKHFFNRMLYLQRLGLVDEFLRLLSYNVEQFRTLLHEIDHCIQFKKGTENVDSFEGLLINLCFYPAIEALGKNNLNFSKFIQLESRMNRLDVVNKKFNCVVPYERLAEIDSSKQILGLLGIFNTEIREIPEVLEFFKNNLFRYYQVGYDKNKKESAPLLRYVEEVKKLNYSELNKIISELESRYSEITTVDDRAKFGLDITSREFNDLKKRVLR